MNNKQIMYDCDKGYVLTEKGPVGATCVGGLWRPTELPSCLPGLHPRLRWTRRKRDLKTAKNPKYLRNYRHFKREISELIRKQIDDPFPVQKVRSKRSLLHHKYVQRKIHRRPGRNQHLNHKWHVVAPAVMRFKRSISQKRYPEINFQFSRPLRNDILQQQRNRFEEEQRRAYNKYYEKIKQKHRNYINKLLRASHSQSISDDEPVIFDTPDNTYRNEDNYKIPAQDPFDEINAYSSMPIPLPNINENRNVYIKKEMNDGIVNNTYIGRGQGEIDRTGNPQRNRNYLPQKPSNGYFEIKLKPNGKNVTDILDLLRSQIVRRRKRILVVQNLGEETYMQNAAKDRDMFRRIKRAPRSPKKTDDLPEEDVGIETETTKKSRQKEPCEVKY